MRVFSFVLVIFSCLFLSMVRMRRFNVLINSRVYYIGKKIKDGLSSVLKIFNNIFKYVCLNYAIVRGPYNGGQ